MQAIKQCALLSMFLFGCNMIPSQVAEAQRPTQASAGQVIGSYEACEYQVGVVFATMMNIAFNQISEEDAQANLLSVLRDPSEIANIEVGFHSPSEVSTQLSAVLNLVPHGLATDTWRHVCDPFRDDPILLGQDGGGQSGGSSSGGGNLPPWLDADIRYDSDDGAECFLQTDFEQPDWLPQGLDFQIDASASLFGGLGLESGSARLAVRGEYRLSDDFSVYADYGFDIGGDNGGECGGNIGVSVDLLALFD